MATSSWDKTLKYWDTRSPTAMATVQLSERCYAMDAKHPMLVVATADRQVHVFDIRKPSQIFKLIPSNLKFQTRAIACFPDAMGFVIGSIEGRCAVQHIENKDKLCVHLLPVCSIVPRNADADIGTELSEEVTLHSSATATDRTFIP